MGSNKLAKIVPITANQHEMYVVQYGKLSGAISVLFKAIYVLIYALLAKNIFYINIPMLVALFWR